MGRTRKPCPGCGEVCSYRPAAEVCHGCKTLMEDGRAWREWVAVSVGESEVAKTGALPYLRDDPREGDMWRGKEMVDSAFKRLVGVMSAPLTREGGASKYQLGLNDIDPLITPRREEIGYMEPRAFPKGTVAALRELWRAIVALRDNAYRSGKRDGTRIWEELESGELGLKKYEERAS